MAPYLLVVESDPELQRRIGDTLREASYELAAETEAVWAKRSLLVRAPQGLVVDTNLSDGTGFQVAEELRRDPDTKDVPIFFIASRFRGAAHEAEARRRFAPAEYLALPLDLNTLLARVLEAVPPTVPRKVTASVPIAAGAAMADVAQRTERRHVERDARQLSAGDSELSGTLARQPFARLLQRIYARRLSGALLVAHETSKKIVYFQDGYPVSVRSNVLDECLGQLLLARRLISEEALEESLRRMKQDKRQQGAILVEMGLISPYRLSRALVEQMEAKLLDLFAWRAGSFAFKEDQPVPGEPVLLERTTAALILDGIRRYYDEDRIEAVLAAYAGQYVTPTSDPLRRLQDITTEPSEQAFVEAVDGTRKLEAVLGQASIAREKARLLLVAMAEAGMVEPVAQRKGSADERRGAADTAPLPPTKSRSELASLLEVKRAMTHFEALGVADTAREPEIEQAHERLAREYHPDRYRGRSGSSRELAQRIFDRLGEARDTLTNPSKRARYLAQLEPMRSSAKGRAGADTAAEQVYYTGVEHLRSRRYPEAVEAFRRATALAPARAGYHGALGWALYRQAPADADGVAAGQGELERAVALDPKDPWIRVSLGRFFAETGRPDQAVAEFTSALALNPALTDIEEEIRRLHGG